MSSNEKCIFKANKSTNFWSWTIYKATKCIMWCRRYSRQRTEVLGFISVQKAVFQYFLSTVTCYPLMFIQHILLMACLLLFHLPFQFTHLLQLMQNFCSRKGSFAVFTLIFSDPFPDGASDINSLLVRTILY